MHAKISSKEIQITVRVKTGDNVDLFFLFSFSVSDNIEIYKLMSSAPLLSLQYTPPDSSADAHSKYH